MLMFLFASSVFLSLLVGVVVLVKGANNFTNITLFALIILMNLWNTTVYLVNAGEGPTLLLFRTTFIMVILIALSVYYFSTSIIRGYKRDNKDKIYIPLLTAVFTFAALTPFNISSVEILPINDGFVVAPERGLGYFVILFWILGLIAYSLYVLYSSLGGSNTAKRKQTIVIIYGTVFALISGVTTNMVLPNIAGDTASTALSPLSTLLFASVMAYAIVRHRFLDIKLVVARSIGYFLSVLSIALLFAFSAFLAINFITEDDLKVTVSQQIFFTLIAVALAFVFQPVKRFFDKLSNSIFYRDAYDTQEFLDEHSRVLVSKVDLEPMLEDVTSVIGHNLKNSFTSFFIRKTQYIDTRLLGDEVKDFNEKDFAKISELVSHVHQGVIALDEFDGDDELKQLMQKYDISIIARLVTTIEYELEGVGFLALGPKKSGSPYTRQDVKMMEIIANELVIAIQNALRFEEIQEFNITLQQKVDDATKQLRRSNEKLKEMDETKDEFISMASHQLRTPLTSVKGYLSMVLEGDAGDIKPMQEKLLSQAFTSSQRMVYLIADLLNVSRLRTGKFVIEPIRANLADIAEGEVQQLKETASSRQLTLQYDKPADFPDLMLDETKIRQVIMNFIDNAIYYTPSNGTITVELKDKKDSVELTVTDTGMGVPKVDQPNLFTKFYRAGNAKKARPDGTGLGLFMAKKVIIEQGGAIIFKSKEGDGSTFGFTLPKAGLTPDDSGKNTSDKNDN